MHVGGKHGGVEHDGQWQAARHVDVAQAQRMQCRFTVVALPLLAHVNMKSHVVQAVNGQALQLGAGQQNAVGEKRSTHATRPNMAHDF